MSVTKEIKGLRTRYKVTGEGEVIILLHGWGCDLSIFEKIQTNLEANFLVYSIDLPGFGETEAPGEVWGVEEYTQFVEEFIRVEGISNPTLLGHSFGGRISILYSSRNETKKVVLVDSAGVKPKRSMRYYIKVYSYKMMKRLLFIAYSKEKAQQKIDAKKAKSGSSDYNSAKGIVQNILVKVVNEDLKHVMPSIKAPTLLIWGETDTATPVSDAKIMEKLIPDAGLVVLPNVGHYSFIERMGDFLAILNNFMGVK